ncbi:hypothetical protein AB0K53_02980 [Streptomyces tuirus]|uniref:hypothetical protein n=1 Tax=Streptomyces tuirus TaxID=68278 RepID=UPI00343A0C7E
MRKGRFRGHLEVAYDGREVGEVVDGLHHLQLVHGGHGLALGLGPARSVSATAPSRST